MAMKRDSESHPDLIVSWADVRRSPGHALYYRLQKLLVEAGVDGFVEDSCQAYYAPRMGAPSLPPGRYLRMLLIGYFERIHSERGIVWRFSDSLSLREFLRLTNQETVPDHSWMSKTRSRPPHEAHDKIFGWVLALIAGHDLVKAERIGKSAVGRRAIHKRGEMFERSFTHILDRGGMRRAWLRGRENLHKRYLIHFAGFNIGFLMRALFGCGTSEGGCKCIPGRLDRLSDRG